MGAEHAGPLVPLLLVAFTIATIVMDKFVRIMYENIQAKNIIAPKIALLGILSEMHYAHMYILFDKNVRVRKFYLQFKYYV